MTPATLAATLLVIATLADIASGIEAAAPSLHAWCAWRYTQSSAHSAGLGALADAIGPGRVGFRISPGNPYNGMDPSDPAATFGPFVKAADPLGLAYLHVVDMALPDLDTLALLRANFSGPIVTNNGLKADTAAALLDAGRADAASFGRPFISNPDLVARFKAGAPLAKPDFTHVYTGEEQGYIDYPTMA